ncbi:hypothetical protein CRG98_045663 [Punica granatum]|uniref:Uncharacterized protein n=1 Tax=Punica granatum TaxID=22663 RepID=A0A2I0HRS2_PUNGR|nr:hypothetical protein CRG98_045663 [Punica granatum]
MDAASFTASSSGSGAGSRTMERNDYPLDEQLPQYDASTVNSSNIGSRLSCIRPTTTSLHVFGGNRSVPWDYVPRTSYAGSRQPSRQSTFDRSGQLERPHSDASTVNSSSIGSRSSSIRSRTTSLHVFGGNRTAHYAPTASYAGFRQQSRQSTFDQSKTYSLGNYSSSGFQPSRTSTSSQSGTCSHCNCSFHDESKSNSSPDTIGCGCLRSISSPFRSMKWVIGACLA